MQRNFFRKLDATGIFRGILLSLHRKVWGLLSSFPVIELETLFFAKSAVFTSLFKDFSVKPQLPKMPGFQNNQDLLPQNNQKKTQMSALPMAKN